MRQSFLTYAVDDAVLPDLTAALVAAGYQTTPPRRRPLNLQVRIRQDTGDEAEVQALVAQHAPDATPGPLSTPSRHLINYRDGYR